MLFLWDEVTCTYSVYVRMDPPNGNWVADIVDQNVEVMEVGVTCSGLDLVLLSHIQLTLLRLCSLHYCTTAPQADEMVVSIQQFLFVPQDLRNGFNEHRETCCATYFECRNSHKYSKYPTLTFASGSLISPCRLTHLAMQASCIRLKVNFQAYRPFFDSECGDVSCRGECQ